MPTNATKWTFDTASVIHSAVTYLNLESMAVGMAFNNLERFYRVKLLLRCCPITRLLIFSVNSGVDGHRYSTNQEFPQGCKMIKTNIDSFENSNYDLRKANGPYRTHLVYKSSSVNL